MVKGEEYRRGAGYSRMMSARKRGPPLCVCGSSSVMNTTARHPDTDYRHTLPGRFDTCVVAVL